MNGMIEKQGDGVKVNWMLTLGIAVLMVGVTGSGMLLIREIQAMSTTMSSVQDTLTEFKVREAGLEARIRSLETTSAGDRRDLANALNLLTRIDQRLERIEQRSAP